MIVTVIASAAKQSSWPGKGLDCFLAVAARNDDGHDIPVAKF